MWISAVLACGSLLVWFAPGVAWDWQPALAASQPWRWWSAALVHWSEMHLAANLAGVAVVGALGRVAQVPTEVSLAWLASWPLLHLALLLQPELAHYGGLSGLLHAGVAAAATYIVRYGPQHQRPIGWAILLGMVVKIVWEAPWGEPLRHVAGWDIATAPLAHATGALAGVSCTLLALAMSQRRPRRAGATPSSHQEH